VLARLELEPSGRHTREQGLALLVRKLGKRDASGHLDLLTNGLGGATVGPVSQPTCGLHAIATACAPVSEDAEHEVGDLLTVARLFADASDESLRARPPPRVAADAFGERPSYFAGCCFGVVLSLRRVCVLPSSGLPVRSGSSPPAPHRFVPHAWGVRAPFRLDCCYVAPGGSSSTSAASAPRPRPRKGPGWPAISGGWRMSRPRDCPACGWRNYPAAVLGPASSDPAVTWEPLAGCRRCNAVLPTADDKGEPRDWIEKWIDESELSSRAREGLNLAREARRRGVSLADLARERGIPQSTVRDRVARAYSEVERPRRTCKGGDHPIPPSRTLAADYCGPACKQRAYRGRGRSRHRRSRPARLGWAAKTMELIFGAGKIDRRVSDVEGLLRDWREKERLGSALP
jgi:hypothetical protein